MVAFACIVSTKLFKIKLVKILKLALTNEFKGAIIKSQTETVIIINLYKRKEILLWQLNFTDVQYAETLL